MNEDPTPPTCRSVVPAPELRLYDDALQTLYGVALQLEYLAKVVEESPAEARGHIEQTILRLNELIIGLRSEIYRLY